MIRSKSVPIAVVVTAVVVVWVLQGCGGGGTGTGLPRGRGGIIGQVVDVATGQGIGNMTVTIGGQQGVSATPDGAFTVRNIVPGTHSIAVTETELFVLVPGPPVYVSVQADNFTNLAGPIYIIDRNYLPPGR